jgi:AsmA protein
MTLAAITWKRLGIAAAVLVALVVLAVAALYVVVATIDVDEHRDRIEVLVSRSLDREVRIGGPIELQRSLRPRFTVQQLTVANAPWASQPLLASVERLEIQVALLPLLARRLEIVELRIVGADVHLERGADGTPNWVFGRKEAGTGKPGMAARVLALAVERSRFDYRDGGGVQVEAAIEEAATVLTPGRPVRIRLQGRYQQLPIDLRLDGDDLEHFLSATEAWNFRGRAAVGGLRAEVSGKATDPLKLTTMDLALEFHGTHAGAFRSILTRYVPRLASYRGTGRFTAGRDGLGFELRIDGADLDLSKLWTGLDATPTFSISAQRVELAGRGTAATLSALLTRANWQLHAEGAELRWRHHVDQPPLTLRGTDVTAATDGGPIDVTLLGSHGGGPYRARASLGPLATLVSRTEPWTIDAAVESGDAHGHLQGALGKPFARWRLDGAFTAGAGQLSALGAFAGIELPARGPARIAGRLAWTRSNLQLSELDATVARSRVRGAFAWQKGGVPRMRIRLAPSRLDIADLGSKTPPAGPAPVAGGADDGRVIPDIVLASEALRQASLEVAVERLELAEADQVLASLTGQLRMADGRLLLATVGSDVAGAPIDAQVTFDASRDPARLDADVDIRSIDYGALLRATGVTENVQGQLDLRVKLSGEGNSLRSLVRTAAGRVEIVGGEARMKGRMLELWGGNLVQILNPVAWAQGGDTELVCIAGRFDFGEGAARSRTLLVDSRHVTVAGELVLDLETEEINGLFKPEPKQATLVSLGDPLLLSGTLKQPRVRPADRSVVKLGKLAIGIAQPAALIVLFGDLGAQEKNPCAALLTAAGGTVPTGQARP